MLGWLWYRLLLSILLSAVILWLWSTRFDELWYHSFTTTELTEIGDALLFKNLRAQIKPNSYVSVSGVLGQRAATLRGLRSGSFRYGRYQVRNLLGSKIYLEYDENLLHAKFNPFTRVYVKGRLTDFGPKSELGKVRKFFKNYYNKSVPDDAVLIVVNEKPRTEFIYMILFLFSLVIILSSFVFSALAFRKKILSVN